MSSSSIPGSFVQNLTRGTRLEVTRPSESQDHELPPGAIPLTLGDRMHQTNPVPPNDAEDTADGVAYNFGVDRRGFVQVLGAGLMIAVGPGIAFAQNRRGPRGEGAPTRVSARIHLGRDGAVTVLTGKVEMGQGARSEISQAAAEELHVSVDRVQLIMGDTGLVPDDGITAGSRSTPSTLPSVRQAAAAARRLLSGNVAARWGVEESTLEITDGVITHSESQRSMTYAALAAEDNIEQVLQQSAPASVTVTTVADWKVLGTSVPRPNGRGLVTGAHLFPSDLKRPGMLYGKVLRAPAYGAKLTSIDLGPAQAMKDVVVVRDGDFVAVAAPTTFHADQALQVLSESAHWESVPHPSSAEIYEYLRTHAQGGIPANPFTDELSSAQHKLRATYHAAYVQHAPMETRTALAEWQGEALTVWTGTQNPFGYHSELARAFRLQGDKIRVIVPDFGGGFGGKHTGEVAVEAARIAQGARRPVLLRWTRAEEFTWAYFRPAAVIDAEATLDAKGSLTSWHFINVNSGGSAVETPYRTGKAKSRFIASDAPLRQGSYRALAATANTFARECFMDELAGEAGADSLEFRIAHLENARLRAVLEEAAKRFDWPKRAKEHREGVGVGLACGTEKGSYVAACVEIALRPIGNGFTVRRVVEAFECGAIVNPANLLSQVQGAIVMGLGPALREAMQFEEGRMINARFSRYSVPRFKDVPEIEVHLLNRPDLPSVGAGETPLIAVAPAIANAVFRATGKRVRQMPIRLDA